MTSVFDQDNLKTVELKPCPFCGDNEVSSYVRDGLIGVVECPCGAQMIQEMPRLGVGVDGRPGLSEQQIQMLERFRKKHRLSTQIEAVSLWSRCLAVDAWNLRGGK